MGIYERPPLKLEFSHNIIEHLGLKLYQNKPTNVIAELVSNSWDADAENVEITIGSNNDFVTIADDGLGMDIDAIENKYLIIGLKKRNKSNILQKSEKKSRNLMGRKGIGKLAPFGIAGKVTVATISQQHCFSCFTLDVNKMLELAGDGSMYIDEYHPDIHYLEADSSEIDTASINNTVREFLTSRGFFTTKPTSGTLIFLESLALKKLIPADTLIESLGRRFTVTLLKDDFNVSVNGKLVETEQALPAFDFRYPEQGFDEVAVHINGKERLIRHWAGFVKKADWPHDEAGVGVYAHGKIAQDRPYFFGVKGKEIYTRYMYAVVEADWLDELDEDVISTDRTSVNWDTEDTSQLWDYCNALVKGWITKYQKDHSPGSPKKIMEILSEPDSPRITSAEKAVISDLVSKLGPQVHKDQKLQAEITRTVASSWTHKPMRALIKTMWDNLDLDQQDASNFKINLDILNEHLVPESLSMSVVQAQKVYALSKLYSLKNNGNENQLQALLEAFPWILGTGMESMRPNHSLRENIVEAAANGQVPSHGALKAEMKNVRDSQLRPDFVFYSNESETQITVVELKSPAIPLEIKNRSQLHAYMDWFEAQIPKAKINGILIGKNEQHLAAKRDDVTILSWDEVYSKSRATHLELLAAMLHSVTDHYDDTRIDDIMAMGGEQTKELLSKMASAHSPLRDFFEDVDRRLEAKAPKR